MIVLDTNVISELMRESPDSEVIHWVDSQPASDLFTTAITIAELLYGISRLPAGRRRTVLSEVFEEMVSTVFADRVLPFDGAAAAHYAAVVTTRERIGRPISMADAQIGAICRAREATLATRNTSDFEHVDIAVADPWTSGLDR